MSFETKDRIEWHPYHGGWFRYWSGIEGRYIDETTDVDEAKSWLRGHWQGYLFINGPAAKALGINSEGASR